MNFFKSTPSKYGKGTGLLWRGMNQKLLNSFVSNIFYKSKSKLSKQKEKLLKYESARSALYNCLIANDVGIKDEIIVSSFTCDAVTFAVKRTGAKIVYVDINDDLTMNDREVLNAINAKTKAIIFQNTFGRLGLKKQTIDKIKAKRIFLIEDCVLSIGSKIDDINLGSFGDISFFSLEVSKTITIGWGGLVKINNQLYKDKMLSRYFSLKSISAFADCRRFIQLWLSVLLTNLQPSFGIFLWYFLYGTKIFRTSSTYTLPPKNIKERMGPISIELFNYIYPNFTNFYKISRHNYKFLLDKALKLNLNCPIIENSNEFIVTPRIPIIVDKNLIDKIIIKGAEIGVETGRWFSEVPPKWELSNSRIHSHINSLKISSSIINIPCHWTLKKSELIKLQEFLIIISNLEIKKLKSI